MDSTLVSAPLSQRDNKKIVLIGENKSCKSVLADKSFTILKVNLGTIRVNGDGCLLVVERNQGCIEVNGEACSVWVIHQDKSGKFLDASKSSFLNGKKAPDHLKGVYIYGESNDAGLISENNIPSINYRRQEKMRKVESKEITRT